MSQRGVETTLGRLVTDETMRRRLKTGAARLLLDLAQEGIELNPVERSALATLEPNTLERFARAIDARLQKAKGTPLED